MNRLVRYDENEVVIIFFSNTGDVWLFLFAAAILIEVHESYYNQVSICIYFVCMWVCVYACNLETAVMFHCSTFLLQQGASTGKML